MLTPSVITEWQFHRNPCSFRWIRLEWTQIARRWGHRCSQRGFGRPGTLMDRCESHVARFPLGSEEIPDSSMSEMRADTSTIGEKVAGAGSASASLIRRHQ